MTDDDDPPEPVFPTPREWMTAVHELRSRLMQDRPRAFPPGKTRTCPVCDKRMLESRDDLVRETVVGAMALVHHHLHGARCRHCGSEFLEAYEELALEEVRPEDRLADYEAKVTNVSGRNLGTYWPKDVVRVMNLSNQDALKVQVLDPDTMIVRRKQNAA